MARRVVGLVALVAALLLQLGSGNAAERRLALVIANSNYGPYLSPLENTRLDGQVMAEALKNLGFEVREVYDLDQAGLKQELLDFVRSIKDAGENAVAFFYFSGHGAADTSMYGDNFLIPVGAGISDTEELRARGVNLKDVIKPIEAAQPRASFVVLDACRNVAFKSATKSLYKGFVPESKSAGILIGYATRPGEVAQDNNQYAKSLAGALQTPTMDATGIFKEVQIEVARLSNHKQIPWTEDGLLARIYFRDAPPGATPTPVPSASQPPPVVTSLPTQSVAPPASTAPRVPPTAGPSPAPLSIARPQTPATPQIAAVASPEGILRPGNVVVTGFGGSTQAGGTSIDPDAAVARILDASSTRAMAESRAPGAFNLRGRDVGQIFGLAIDEGDTPGEPANLYLAATSAYGLPVSAAAAPGEALRLLDRGAPGAQWAPGLFGVSRGGGPGSIWKVDGRTGQAALFADIRLNGVRNSGPALGQLAFDPRTRQLFVSDLDTGMIHRLSTKGTDLGTWDHGVAGRPRHNLAPVADDRRLADPTSSAFDPGDANTWGMTDKRRRVWGLAVRGDRLYYGVSDGPQVWSIGIRVDGSFAGDARQEATIAGAPDGTNIPQIRFDEDGNMFVGLLVGATVNARGSATQRNPATVVRFNRDQAASEAEPRWSQAREELAIGNAVVERGVAFDFGYGYAASGEVDHASCKGTLWSSAWQPGQDSVSRGQPVLLAWQSGGAGARATPVLHALGDRAFALPGSMASLAPCARDTIDGVATLSGETPQVRPPVWDAQPATQVATTSGSQLPTSSIPGSGQGPAGTNGRLGPEIVTGGAGRPPLEVASSQVPASTLPCARVQNQRFQCVGGAWELEIRMDDEARRGLDALTVSPLVTGALVQPSRQLRARPTDPFRIRFEGVPSGTQVPLDVCLHDEAQSLNGSAFRCCRAEITVSLPVAACASQMARLPAASQAPRQ